MNRQRIYEKKNNIFQSPIWAEFQKAVGREPTEIEGAYFYKEHLIRDKFFLYCPKGPAWKIPNYKIQITNKLQNLNDQNIVFVRIEPDSGQARMTQEEGFKPVTKNSILSQQYSPKQTLVLDLTKSEEEILANMKPKHRYNIRLAEKKGVKIRQGISKRDIDDFYELSLEVSNRDSSYSPHPKGYYKKMVETIGESDNLQIFTAEYQGKVLSSLIILFYKDTAIYIHGASSNENREVMPNHLAQWEAIKEAKKRGCKYYDFWGTSLRKKSVSTVIPNSIGDPEEKELDSRLRGNDKNGGSDDSGWEVDESHSWAGVSKFKLGFVKLGVTEDIVEFPGAYDLPINKFWYNGLSVLNRFRKLIKR